jgi:hypothetical protein
VQAGDGEEREAERLSEGASWSAAGKQNRTKGQSESRKLKSEGWPRKLVRSESGRRSAMAEPAEEATDGQRLGRRISRADTLETQVEGEDERHSRGKRQPTQVGGNDRRRAARRSRRRESKVEAYGSAGDADF